MLNNDKVLFRFVGPMGVRVDVGQSIVILLGILVYFGISSDLVYAFMFPALLFVAIYLHELGHAWGNLVQGIPVRRIMLHGGGGFCESKRSYNPYEQELVVAMGPIVNAVLWAVSALLANWIYARWDATGAQPSLIMTEAVYFLWLFGWINLLLLIFNMIPVQPLDGGKLFHLVMLRVMNAESAQMITGAVGLALSVMWIPAMIAMYYFEGWVLFFIPSIFVHYRMMRGAPAY